MKENIKTLLDLFPDFIKFHKCDSTFPNGNLIWSISFSTNDYPLSTILGKFQTIVGHLEAIPGVKEVFLESTRCDIKKDSYTFCLLITHPVV